MKVILHNSISLDGSFLNFEVNMELHYRIAGNYKSDAHLIGSKTAKTGIEMYGGAPPEKKKDFMKPRKENGLPYWGIPDTKGILKGMLHAYRRFEFCRDVIVFVSEKTPKDYINHLEERDYDYHVVGKEKVNLKKALRILSTQYNVKTVLIDTGRELNSMLLNQGLVNEISLLISPELLGKQAEYLFSEVSGAIKLEKAKCTIYDDYIWLVYKVRKSLKKNRG